MGLGVGVSVRLGWGGMNESSTRTRLWRAQKVATFGPMVLYVCHKEDEEGSHWPRARGTRAPRRTCSPLASSANAVMSARGTSRLTMDGMSSVVMVGSAVICPLIHSMVVVTSPMGVHAPPALAAITTTAPKKRRSSGSCCVCGGAACAGVSRTSAQPFGSNATAGFWVRVRVAWVRVRVGEQSRPQQQDSGRGLRLGLGLGLGNNRDRNSRILG